jgi:hypothetical protein
LLRGHLMIVIILVFYSFFVILVALMILPGWLLSIQCTTSSQNKASRKRKTLCICFSHFSPYLLSRHSYGFLFFSFSLPFFALLPSMGYRFFIFRCFPYYMTTVLLDLILFLWEHRLSTRVIYLYLWADQITLL